MFPDWKSMDYEPQGKISDDGRSFLWSFSDLFEEDGFPSEIWSYEIFALVSGQLQKFRNEKQNGLLILLHAKPEGEEEFQRWFRWVEPHEVEGYNIDDQDCFRMTMDIVLGFLHLVQDDPNEYLILSFSTD